MKNLGLCIILLAACGSSSSNGGGGGDGSPDASGPMNDADVGVDASMSDAMACTADTQVDPNNCGACGRSCLGTACIVGRCTAERLDSGDISGIGDFTTDGLFLYYSGFTASGSALHRLWKIVIGPAASTSYLTSFAHPTPLSQIAFDGNDFYTAEPVRIDTIDRGTVKKINKEPFAESNLAAFQKPTTTAILLHGGLIYYATDIDGGNGGDIKRISTSGGIASTIIAPAGIVAFLGADASNIYWLDVTGGTGLQHALKKAPLAGGSPITVITGTSDFFDMDATRIFMVRKNTSELLSISKTNGTATTLAINMTSGGAADNEYVYAAQTNKLMAVAKSGGTPTVIWESEPQGTSGCPTIMNITKTKVIGSYVYFLVVPVTCNGIEIFNQIHRIARM